MAVFTNPSSQQSPASASWLESIRAPASSAKTATVMLFTTLSCCSSGYRQYHLLDRELPDYYAAREQVECELVSPLPNLRSRKDQFALTASFGQSSICTRAIS